MKLKNKLLPIAGIATLVATTAPIALTSCGSNSNNEWFDFATHTYVPSMEKHVTGTMSVAEANKAYFGDEDEWLDDDEVAARFAEDYIWSASKRIYYNSSDTVKQTVKENDPNEIYWSDKNEIPLVGNTVKLPTNTLNSTSNATTDEDFEYTSYKLKFNYVKIGHATTVELNKLLPDSFTVPTVSYEVEYEYTYTYVDDNSVQYDRKYSGTLTITDLPVTVDYWTDEFESSYIAAWWVAGDYDTLKLTEYDETYSKIPFSYVDTYTLVETQTEKNKSSTSTSEGQEIYFSSMGFEDTDDIYDFLYYTGCPEVCSYYMLSVAKK